MTPVVVLLSTVATAEDARRIADALVERRLAACVSAVSGLRSTYRWQGKVERADEVLLVIKTVGARVEEVRQAFLAGLHPYEVPELLVVPVGTGEADDTGMLRQSFPGAEAIQCGSELASRQVP